MLPRFAVAGGFRMSAIAAALRSVIVEDEQANRRGQIALAPAAVDRGDEIGQGHVPDRCDLFQPLPERILEADAGLVSGDHDRSFDDRRFHRSSPVSILQPSSSRAALSARAFASLRSTFERPNAKRLRAVCAGSARRPFCLRTYPNLTSSPMFLLPASGPHRGRSA